MEGAKAHDPAGSWPGLGHLGHDTKQKELTGPDSTWILSPTGGVSRGCSLRVPSGSALLQTNSLLYQRMDG
jgi:hypothetical protein